MHLGMLWEHDPNYMWLRQPTHYLEVLNSRKGSTDESTIMIHV